MMKILLVVQTASFGQRGQRGMVTILIVVQTASFGQRGQRGMVTILIVVQTASFGQRGQRGMVTILIVVQTASFGQRGQRGMVTILIVVQTASFGQRGQRGMVTILIVVQTASIGLREQRRSVLIGAEDQHNVRSVVTKFNVELANMRYSDNEFMRRAAKWKLQIAEHKCCVLSHGNVTQPMYYMHTVQLPNVNKCRDLGVFVDSHCNFKQHILHICRKSYMSINDIFRCFHTARVSALIIAYQSFVRPILEYCSTVWNPYIPNRHYLGLTDQIERVQRYFTRRVYYRCKLDCSHDYLQRLEYLNLESLELRTIYNDLVMVYRIFHGLVNINANELIHVKTSTSTISTRGHRFKLQTSQFKRDVAKNQFCN